MPPHVKKNDTERHAYARTCCGSRSLHFGPECCSGSRQLVHDGAFDARCTGGDEPDAPQHCGSEQLRIET